VGAQPATFDRKDNGSRESAAVSLQEASGSDPYQQRLVYYAKEGEDVVLLLCAGSKRNQSADIK
jgi:hypothetical protein